MPRLLAATLATAALAPLAATADPARIVAAEARPGTGGWTVSVTLSHGDTGWDDYADGWRILDGSGAVLGTRELLHPHVNEQPFTRSLRVESLPRGETLYVESSTNVTGWSGDTATLTLPE